MSKEKKLSVGNYESARAFLDALSTSIDISSDIKVIDTNTGVINEGQENYCPTFKVKLKNYQNESLDGLVNTDIILNKYDLSFVLDKLKQPVGLALVAELADISLR